MVVILTPRALLASQERQGLTLGNGLKELKMAERRKNNKLICGCPQLTEMVAVEILGPGFSTHS